MANEFKTTVGNAITRKEAKDWIAKYDNEHRKDKGKDTQSIFYGRDLIEKILKQDGVTGISFFLANKHCELAKKDLVQLVLVGTKEDGTLLWPSDGIGKDGDDGGIAGDNGVVCPPLCPK